MKLRKFPAKPVVEEATMRLPVVVVAKTPRIELVPLREVAPRPREVVPWVGKMKRLSVEEANLELPEFRSVPQKIEPLVLALRSQLAAERFVTASEVVVAWLPVALTKVKFCKVEEPSERRFPTVVRPEALRVVPKMLVEKRFVVVACVPVALTKVRFWRVEELLTRRFPTVARPELLSVVPKILVEKKLVVVACVVVERSAINPPVKVEEAVEIKPFKKPRVVEVETPHD